MLRRLGAFTIAAVVAFPVWIGGGQAQSPTPPPRGPVQGYQGGYDPRDKSEAPAAPGGKQADTGNPDEGRVIRDVADAVVAVDGRRLTLQGGLVLVIPATLTVEPEVLRVGTRVRARYQDQGGALIVTAIERM